MCVRVCDLGVRVERFEQWECGLAERSVWVRLNIARLYNEDKLGSIECAILVQDKISDMSVRCE